MNYINVKYSDFVNENMDTVKDIIFKIENECGDYLNHLHNDVNNLVFRGERFKEGAILKGKYHSKRTPKHTSNYIHDMANKISEKILGVPLRNGISATKHYTVAKSYGDVYLFFPIDKFKYYWNKDVDDFFNYIVNPKNYPNGDTSKKRKLIGEIIPNYTNTHLEFNRGQELLFFCEEYYLVHEKYASAIIEYIRNRS